MSGADTEAITMPSAAGGAPHVVIIGAGVVGACIATYLQQQGARITLIDRQTPGDDGAASFGNAGSLSSASVVPTPAPGMLRKVPGWLLKEHGPLTIRWSYLPKLLPWLAGFIRAGGDAGHQRRAAAALAALHAPTFEFHSRLARDAGVPELLAPGAYLHVYGSEESYTSAAREWTIRREHGADFEVLDRDALHEAEPDLATHYVKGVRIKDQGRTLNPGRLVRAYVERVVANGGVLLRAEATDIEASAGRVSAVRTGDGTVEGDAFVLSAGAFSRRLTDRLGLRLPLDTERGYHVTCPEPGITVAHTVMEADCKFVANPMAMGVRFAGMVEMAGVDAPANPRRAEVIRRLARRMYPKLRLEGATQWMGHRPSMPDGLPVIGPSPRHENLWLAFGHGHTGMVAGPMTGRIVAGMITGPIPNIDVRPFRADRF
ncbi:MAG: FAD-dependent oxidoreductase [Thiotrichales bacterium]|nr:FAD-dependent oxidoreductase [Thiotrichales bacterium]